MGADQAAAGGGAAFGAIMRGIDENAANREKSKERGLIRDSLKRARKELYLDKEVGDRTDYVAAAQKRGEHYARLGMGMGSQAPHLINAIDLNSAFARAIRKRYTMGDVEQAKGIARAQLGRQASRSVVRAMVGGAREGAETGLSLLDSYEALKPQVA